ncbi:MAG: hypothetical protein KDE34_15350, partial [Anaerolineales bacterium]|nr:hypothetical protein [Anaerolineales bacterium]
IDKAIRAYERAYSLATRAGEQGMATAILALNNLGEAYQGLFAMDKALEQHRKALELAATVPFPFTSDLYRNLGVDLLALGDIDNCIAHLYRALAAAEESDEPEIELQVLYSLAMAELERDQLDVAADHVDLLQQKAEAAKAQGALASAYYARGALARRRGEDRLAIQAWQQALFLAHETGQRFLIWNTHCELGQLADDADLCQVHCRIASGVIHQIADPIEDDELRQRFLNDSKVKMILEHAAGLW